MDNTVPPDVGELAARTSEFIRDVVIPVELQVAGVMHDAPDDLRRSLQKQARDAGLLAPHVPKEWGGQMRATCTCSRWSPANSRSSNTFGRLRRARSGPASR